MKWNKSNRIAEMKMKKKHLFWNISLKKNLKKELKNMKESAYMSGKYMQDIPIKH